MDEEKKLVQVGFNFEEIILLDEASRISRRSRSGFIAYHSLAKAREILEGGEQ
jgi:uncharacterized protein (DUF1778 family)